MIPPDISPDIIFIVRTWQLTMACTCSMPQSAVRSGIKFGYLNPPTCNVYSFPVNMAQRKISETQRWQTVWMPSTSLSFRVLRVISRLVRNHGQTDAVKDLPWSVRPPVTSKRDDRTLIKLVRQPFATSPILNGQAAGMASRKFIKRPYWQNTIRDSIWRKLWRHRDVTHTPSNICSFVPYGRGSAMLWNVSHKTAS